MAQTDPTPDKIDGILATLRDCQLRTFGGGDALVELAEVVASFVRRTECDCMHFPEYHDPTTGACLYTNVVFGPCPCAATPPATREVLQRAWDTQREALLEQKDALGRVTPKAAQEVLDDPDLVTCYECKDGAKKATTVEGPDGHIRHGVCHRNRFMGALPEAHDECLCGHEWCAHDYRTKVCAVCGMGKKGEGCQEFKLDERLLCRLCWGDLPLPPSTIQPEVEAKCDACGKQSTLMRVSTVVRALNPMCQHYHVGPCEDTCDCPPECDCHPCPGESALVEPTQEQVNVVGNVLAEAESRAASSDDPALDGF